MSEQLVPQAHKPALPNGSESLYLWEVFRTPVEVHSAETHANGARGDEDHAVSIFVQFDSGLDNHTENRKYRLVRLLIDNGRGAYIALVSYSRFCERGVGVQEVYRV